MALNVLTSHMMSSSLGIHPTTPLPIGISMQDCCWKFLDWKRVNTESQPRDGRAYAEIHSEANNETFWVEYNQRAGEYLEKAAATSDTSSTVIWMNRDYDYCRAKMTM